MIITLIIICLHTVIWFGWVLWHINYCMLFNAIFSLYIYIEYMISFGWVLWHINYCRLFNAIFSLYIYIKYIWFGLVGFYGISTIVGYFLQIHFVDNIFKRTWAHSYAIFYTVLFLAIQFSISHLFGHSNQLICLVGGMFTNGPGDLGSIQDCVIPKTLKMALDSSLLKTHI